MTQLEQDLTKRIDDKLLLWMADSFELFSMADISERANYAIIRCLVRALCAGLAESNADDKFVCELMVAMMQKARYVAAKAKERCSNEP